MNAQHGIELFKTHTSKVTMFNMIFVNLTMPSKSGFEVVNEIR